METADKTAKRYAAMDRKKRAVMAYLKASGHAGDFDTAFHGWLAGSPADVISFHKPLRQDGSINYNNAINAVFEEIDNIDAEKDPKLARAVQSAYRIYRGVNRQKGDDPEFDQTHSYDEQSEAEAAYTGAEGGKPISQKRWDELHAKAPNKSGVGSPRPVF